MSVPRPESSGGEDETFTIDVPRWRAGAGAVGFLLFVGYLLEAMRLDPGSLSDPGPGLFPIVIGTGGIVSTGFVVVEALRASRATATLPKGRRAKDVIFLLIGLFAAVLLLPILGMYIVGPVYTAATAWGLAPRHRWRGAIIGAAVVLGVCFVFTEVLQVRLPTPIW